VRQLALNVAAALKGASERDFIGIFKIATNRQAAG
jgi:hypothetical protein